MDNRLVIAAEKCRDCLRAFYLLRNGFYPFNNIL